MELKAFRGQSTASSRRGSKETDGVVLTRFASLNKEEAEARGSKGNYGVILNKEQGEARRLSLGLEGEVAKTDPDKTASLRRQLLAPPAKPRDTKSLNI